MTRTLVFAGFVVFLTGCEHGITLTGTVKVGAALTAGLTETEPGVVIVTTTVPKTSVPSYRVGVLCEAASADITINWKHDGFGCAKAGTVTARLFTANAEAIGVACGITTGVGSAPDSANLVSEASAAVFAGNDQDSGCSDGTDSVTLTLEPF